MVSAPDSGSSGTGSRPGWGTALCSQARHFTLIVLLFTQVSKWVSAKLMLGGNHAIDKHSIKGRGGGGKQKYS